MARVYLSGALGIAYTTDQPVGTGCINKRDDVLLVQFFLKVVSEGSMKARFTPPGEKPLVCDGRWGRQSQMYLDRFIVEVQGLSWDGPVLKRDGRVDPVEGGKLTGATSHSIYTILVLNAVYGRTRGPGARNDITTDALFPAALTPSLKLP